VQDTSKMSKASKNGKTTAAFAKGFDFGTPVPYLRVIDPSWTQTITEAQIVGCAYGWHPVLNLRSIPSIALIARNEVRLRSAFATFRNWTQGSDDDAVDVTIIFLNSGAYLLGISPELNRLAARTPIPAIFDRLEIMSSWIKTMDSTHTSLLSLRQYHRQLIAPIALTAAILPSGLLVPENPSSLHYPSDLQPLVKFNYTFAHEDDKEQPAVAQMILKLHRERDRARRTKRAPGPPPPRPSTWFAKRAKVLREMFPLTLFRARSSGLLDSVRSRFELGKIAEWQIEQAVCNTVMSHRLDFQSSHYEGIESDKVVERIAKAAPDYNEIADGTRNLDSISAAVVEEQLRLDVQYLIQVLGERQRRSSLEAGQAILERRGYLAIG
jgi:hypothetical protein